MQQIVRYISVVFYLVFVIGLQLNAHYCMGQLESVVPYFEKSCCCIGDSEMENGGCCSNEELVFQVDDEHQLNSQFDLVLHQFYSSFYFVFYIENQTITFFKLNYNFNKPPPLSGRLICLQKQSLVFYG